MSDLKKTKILLVEDDLNLGFLLVEFLESNNYDVKLYRDGESGLKAFIESAYDFCLLDVMLPIMDGFTLAKKIRDINKIVPIIIITAKSRKEDMLIGYSKGIDDYIYKPFDEDALLCKIKAILMRVNRNENTNNELSFRIGKYLFDFQNHILKFDSEERRLTIKEKDVLKKLVENKNTIVSRSDILNSVWGKDDYFTGRSLDVFITKIRKYLEKDECIKIESIPTIGYILSEKN